METVPTQEQVDAVVRSLAPDVVRVRFNTGRDWSDDPALYFRVVVSDDVVDTDRLGAVARAVRDRVSGEFGLSEAERERIPYFRFRTLSETVGGPDPAWD